MIFLRLLSAATAASWLFLVGWCPPATAQSAPAVVRADLPAPAEPPPITVEAAIDQALAANPDLQGTRRELDAADALRRQAGLLPNPTFSWEQEFVRGGNRAAAYSINVPLELGGKRAARIALADEGRRAAGADVLTRTAEIRALVVATFFALLNAQEREQLARQSFQVAERALDVAARRVQAGRVPPVDETRARVVLATARIEASQAATEVASARRRLAALLARPEELFSAQMPASGRLPAPPDSATLEARIDAAPELLRGRVEVARREAAVSLARTVAVPATSITAGTRTIAETGQIANVVGVSVAIPIFDRNQGNIGEARVRVDQARDALRAGEIRVRTEVRDAIDRLAAARAEAELASGQILPDAESAFNTATRGFELGRFGFLDVLEAQRALFLARAQLLRALAEAWSAAADLERVLGAPAR